MANLTEIQDLLLLSDGYVLELGEQLYNEQKKGCIDCFDASLIERILWLSDILTNQVDRNDYGEQTSRLYECLLGAIGNYSGASISVDPNASIPNTTIIVEGGGDTKPNGLNIFYADMSGDNGSGGRNTYTNPLWIGWYPQMQTAGVIELFQYIDYDYDASTGTFSLLSDAASGVTGIYEGGSIRVTDFSRNGDTPPVDVFTYALINNSSIDTQYILQGVTSDLNAGNNIENPVVVGQSIAADVQTGQQCVYTIYNEDGSVFYTSTRTTAGTINGVSMVANKNHEFIYSNN